MPAEVSWHDACHIHVPLPLGIVARTLHAMSVEFPEASVRFEVDCLIVRVRDDDDE